MYSKGGIKRRNAVAGEASPSLTPLTQVWRILRVVRITLPLRRFRELPPPAPFLSWAALRHKITTLHAVCRCPLLDNDNGALRFRARPPAEEKGIQQSKADVKQHTLR